MGRLHAVKGFDTLILAYQRIAEKLPDWDLVVLGEGAERSRLEALRDRLGLENRVFLPGRTEEPHRALSAGEIFVLSSRAEGFGLALIEAMAAGLAVISTDCPVGPPEIITDGEDGILVPVDDPSALAGAIQELAQNNERRAALSRKAVNVRERFARSSVLAHWGRFLEGFVQATTDGRDISNDARTR
jgi:glycosyltransferase involved in cell wall biosynthesis